MQQEGYGTAAVLPDQGIYLAASVYRPVLQVTCAHNLSMMSIDCILQTILFIFADLLLFAVY